MRIRINSTNYYELKNLTFAPETDITNNALPINEVSADIITDDTITVGTSARLCDDISTAPWLIGMVVYAERLQADTVSVRIQSWFRVLDATEMTADMYSAEPIADVLDDIFGSVSYEIDSSLSDQTISGYVPDQTARERLQWVCLVIGAYVRSYDDTKINIVPMSDSADYMIPMEKTFWKPSITYEDYVARLTVTEYTYTQGTPSSNDDTVEVDGVTYIVTHADRSLVNPNVPSGIVGRTVKISDVYLVNSSNFNAVLNFLSTVYFNRVYAEVDVINNREYFPGDLVQFYLDEDNMATGFIEACNFSFGLQARAKLRINGVDELASAKLIINYLHGNQRIYRKKFRFPIGYQYDIVNPYPDIDRPNHRYVYRPVNANATGTIVSGENVDNEDCEIALHFYYEDDVLYVVSVDELTENEGMVTIS